MQAHVYTLISECLMFESEKLDYFSLLHPNSGKYQLHKQIVPSFFFFNHTPAFVFVHVCVCCVCVGVPHAVALHTMFRAKQPMALGLSRILFILLLILKN